jgi:hypothetical protein
MTPSSVIQFITITFPISCPFSLDGAIRMRRLAIAETGVIPASCSRRPSRKSTRRCYSPKCSMALPGHPEAMKMYCRRCYFHTSAGKGNSKKLVCRMPHSLAGHPMVGLRLLGSSRSTTVWLHVRIKMRSCGCVAFSQNTDTDTRGAG